jgi:hypothetical protein
VSPPLLRGRHTRGRAHAAISSQALSRTSDVYFSMRTSSSTLYVSIGMCGASCACGFAWVFVRAFACVRCFVHVCAGLCACARVCLYMRALECARSYGIAFVSASIFVCVCVQRVCVCMARLCTSRLFSGPPVARRRPVVYSARPAARGWARVRLRSVPSAGLARICRRRELGESYGKRGMGWPMWAHVRDRRRRRHLRHRRRQGQPPADCRLPGRVGEHRRRFVAGLSVSSGVVGGTQVRLVPSAGFARVGHRCELGESHTRAAVGCAFLPLDRDRRFRRHLRYRRRQPGCVGKHRQRCGPDSR